MNVILIVNDTFRRDHLGCYGNNWIHTPNLDRFAEGAAVFDQCYIASYPTVPNRWDICTGRYGFPCRGWQPLDRVDVTLAQLLSQAGVHTEMIWDTPMLAMHDYNYTRGFAGITFVHGQKGDPWITDPSLPVRLPSQPHKIKNTHSLESYMRNHHSRRYEREFCVARTMSAASDWLETNHTHESFFLYVDMWDPHEPFDCPWYDLKRYADPLYEGDRIDYPQYGRPTYMTPGEQQNLRALYAGQVTLVDRWVGHFLDVADRLGLFEDTLIIWTTDHGHLFGERDLQGKPGAEYGRLYEVTTRIPLLVRHPDGIGAGTRVPGLVQPCDLLPSVLDFMDVQVPAQVEGRSIWPLLSGEKLHDYAFSNRFPSKAGDPTYAAVEGAAFDGWVGSDRIVEPATITNEEWAYICAPKGRPSELYHLPTDPEQERDVIDTHPEVAERMLNAWIDFMREHGASPDRLRPFIEAGDDDNVHASPGGRLYAFRDDLGQWIAFSDERRARSAAHRENAPGPERRIEEVTFGELLDDNPRNLIHLLDQYYWAEDLA